jgi:hypothetical protein
MLKADLMPSTISDLAAFSAWESVPQWQHALRSTGSRYSVSKWNCASRLLRLADKARSQGVALVPPSLDMQVHEVAKTPALRAQAGKQPGGKKFPELVKEFREVVHREDQKKQPGLDWPERTR